VILDVGIIFLEDVNLPDLRRKLADQIIRQRVGKAELEVGSAVAKDLACVEITIARTDDSDARFMHLNSIPLAVVGISLQ